MRDSLRIDGILETALECPSLVAVGGRLFTSGLLMERKGGLEPDARELFAAADRLLYDAGSAIDDVVRTRVFYVDDSSEAALRQAHGDVFGNRGPAMSTVRVTALPGDTHIALEIEAVKGAARRIRHQDPVPQWGSSLAVEVGGDIWLSGMTTEDRAGPVAHAGDHGAQATRVIQEAADALAALGSSPRDVVAVRYYSLPEDGPAPRSPTLAGFMAQGEPGAAGIVMAGLNAPDVRFLLEAEAVRGASATRCNIRTGRTYEVDNHYSRAVRVGDVVHVAGTTSLVVGEIVRHPGEVRGQVFDTLETIRWAVEEQGLAWADLARTRTYVVGGQQALIEAAGALRKALRGVEAAATLVAVPMLGRPEVVVEIEATAVRSA